ncbi:hypothetical protein [Ferrimonas gelatinilytica]|uniref:DUF4446 family protein n=1 Tax=Ferrimonas gelatinilytica TaxID=1255257 RepID=A0ABP9S3A1_9GAMM
MNQTVLLVFLCFAGVLLAYVAYLARKHRRQLEQDNANAKQALAEILATRRDSYPHLSPELLQRQSLRDSLHQGLRDAFGQGFLANTRSQQDLTPIRTQQQRDTDALMTDLGTILEAGSEKIDGWALYEALLGQAFQLGGYAYWRLRGNNKQAEKGLKSLQAQRQQWLEQTRKQA